jgi:hypothetical protein
VPERGEHPEQEEPSRPAEDKRRPHGLAVRSMTAFHGHAMRVLFAAPGLLRL